MSHAGESKKVILFAFAANLGIALSKFAGAFWTGSASLMAEAIHSTVDCSNQLLLLLGASRSKRAPDEEHPLGYGREAFFWSFIVAILLFSLGGLFAIYEGVHKLSGHGEVESPLVACAILAFGFVLEAFSFRAALKEIRATNKYGTLWKWFHNSKSSELLVIFTEDAAALLGLLIAALFLGLAWATSDAKWDAMGSIVVGCILVVVAVLLATEIKSFLIGESPDREIRDFMTAKTPDFFPGGSVMNFIAIQTGTSEVMLSCKINPGTLTNLDEAINRTNDLERLVKAAFPVVKWSFVELDRYD